MHEETRFDRGLNGEGGDLQETVPRVDGGEPSRPAAGDLLGDRYELLAELGRGASGVVFRARDRATGARVAVKVLTSHTHTDEVAQRLRLEVRAAWKVTHPVVVRIYDLIEDEKVLALSMEFVNGQTLESLREAGARPTARELMILAYDLACGLEAAHGAGVTHRDLKPANILLRKETRRAVITDFGVSRVAESTDWAAMGTATQSAEQRFWLTKDGALIGTPLYMAPEQLLGEPDIGPPADIFALGIILYEIATGACPFEAKTLVGLLTARQRPLPVPLAKARPDLPRAFCNVVAHCLQFDRSVRIQNGGELRQALNGLKQSVKRAHALRRNVAATVCAALVGAAATAGYLRYKSAQEMVCRGAERKLAGIWDNARRDELRREFEATRAPSAKRIEDRVTQTLDEYTRNWVGMHTDVCEATLRREQPPDVHELRMQCLADRLDTLRADVDLLVKPDQNVVERSLPVVESLPTIAGCGNVAALREPFPPPSDPDVRAKLSALNARLVSAKAELAVGKMPTTLASAMEIATQAQTLAYPRLEAEALYSLAVVEDAMGDRTNVLTTFRRAIRAADAGRDFELAARAQAALAYVLSYKFDRYEEAAALAEDAEARVRGLRWIDPGVHVDILKNCAGALMDAGRMDEARARLEQALSLSEKSARGERTGMVLFMISALETKQGHFRTGLTSFQRVQAAYEAQAGEHHRGLPMLLTNLGLVHYVLDERNEALSALRRAVGLFDRNAPDHESNVIALSYLGFTLARMGQAEAAAQSLNRALQIVHKSPRSGGSLALLPLTGVARALNDAGDPGRALAALGSTEVEAPQPRFDPWEIAWAKLELARALAALGREPSRVARLVSSVRETFAQFPEMVEPEGAATTLLVARH